MNSAAEAATIDTAAMVKRQSTPPKALNRCGTDDPSVSAATSSPTSSPMSPLAQVVAIFMPTG